MDLQIPKLATGCKPLDELLGGGIEYKTITNVYGPAGSGKTNLALLLAVNCAADGKKVIFIDTEGGFSPERLAQIASDRGASRIANQIMLFEPKSFQEQCKLIKDLKKYFSKPIGLLILDSLVTLYRLELKEDKAREVNRKLAKQLSLLQSYASEHKFPVLVTNQVYTNIERNELELSGRTIPRYLSKCLLELQRLGNGSRKAIIRKHRSIPEGREARFKITENGLEKDSGFKLL